MTALSRRRLLALSGAAALGLAVPGSAADAAPARGLPPLPRLPELPLATGADGVRTGVLVAARLGAGDPAGALLDPPALGYGPPGRPSSPGPVVRLREGERVRLEFRNGTGDHTSLHLHGLRVAPSVDLPLHHLMPGQRHTQAFAVGAGWAATYWYHPHVHGMVGPQMLRGLVGPLLVDHAPGRRPGVLAGAEEVLAFLQPLADPSRVLVNGALGPEHRTRAARVRLRLVNAATDSWIRLAAVAADGRRRRLWQVATDAGFLDAAVARDGLVLAPGERAEALVDTAGGFRLVALPAFPGDASRRLLTVTPAAPAPTPPPPAGRAGRVERLRPAAGAVHRRITLDQGVDGYAINGRPFDPDRDDVVARAGAVEVWEVVNTTYSDHPFHLHSYPVQLLDASGRTAAPAAWRDVVTVPARGRVRLAVCLGPYAGRTVLHCHMASHEDAGMMAVLRVV